MRCVSRRPLGNFIERTPNGFCGFCEVCWLAKLGLNFCLSSDTNLDSCVTWDVTHLHSTYHVKNPLLFKKEDYEEFANAIKETTKRLSPECPHTILKFCFEHSVVSQRWNKHPVRKKTPSPEEPKVNKRPGAKYRVIDQACSVKMAGYWPSFFCVFRDRDEVEVHKLAKKERGQYPAIFTEQAWSINNLF